MKAPALRPGDTVGIIAPSWCGPAVYPHRVERGIRFLESLNYTVRLGSHVRAKRGYVSGTPEERAADIHELFAAPEVRAIISAIGGNHSCHLLPLLDFDLIRRNPTIVIGFSDMTVLNLAIYAQTGLVTFNGPALMTDLAEYPEPLPYTIENMLRILTQPQPAGLLKPAAAWTEEFLDWGIQADLTRARLLEPSPGWTWLRAGRAEGVLVGGCLESMEHLRGTPYWPEFTGAILYFETSELAPEPAWVDAVLQDYDNMGVLPRLAGLVVGRPMRYDTAMKAELRAVILDRTRRYSFPILTDVDFGHTAPQLTLPIGCRALLDAEDHRFEILEAAVE